MLCGDIQGALNPQCSVTWQPHVSINAQPDAESSGAAALSRSYHKIWRQQGGMSGGEGSTVAWWCGTRSCQQAASQHPARTLLHTRPHSDRGAGGMCVIGAMAGEGLRVSKRLYQTASLTSHRPLRAHCNRSAQVSLQ